MLVRGCNTDDLNLRQVGEFIARLNPAVAYLSIPTRPPACQWVRAPEEKTLHRAYHIFKAKVPTVELNVANEGDAFAFTGDVEADLMRITAVHPMREAAVADLLRRAGVRWDVVQRMIDNHQLLELCYDDTKFYMRRLPGAGARRSTSVI
jgi:wyosine [tRNA(Phe)-imidazoG37] synthetase (radical SAM superfamily)